MKACRCRPNAVIGRVVPVLLLAYVVSTYRLVVSDFLYDELAVRRSKPVLAVLWGTYLHIHFFLTVFAYLRVFTAKVNQASRFHDSAKVESLGEAPIRMVLWFFQVFTPSQRTVHLPIRPEEELYAKIRHEFIHQCADKEGNLMRCTRDSCQDSWKPARTRHCGDCRKCRTGFDHHCPWFDADVIARYTMASFLLFLVLGATLLVAALAPLTGRAYDEIKILAHRAWNSPDIERRWWSKWWSWAGGPTVRYSWPLVLAQRELSGKVIKGHRVSLYAPVTVSIAVLLTLIVIGLLATTLHAAARGDLSVDVMRRRAGLESTLFFWVPLGLVLDHSTSDEHLSRAKLTMINGSEGVVIELDDKVDRPYDWGFWANLAIFLQRPSNEKELLQWPISPQKQSLMIERALEMLK